MVEIFPTQISKLKFRNNFFVNSRDKIFYQKFSQTVELTVIRKDATHCEILHIWISYPGDGS